MTTIIKKITFFCAFIMWHMFLATINLLQAQNTNLPVGAIPGAVDVSPMGAATYTIPIEVVPGTQGMQPNLSIQYNSFGGMGLLGMKWNLTGLSAITRCGQTPYYDDGNITAVQLNSNDRFALDGNRLVATSGGYGNVGTIYATEMEDFSRLVSYEGYTGTPDYFKAYTDDGMIVEYGYPDSAKHRMDCNYNNNQYYDKNILTWWVNKITDVNGNFMTFHYEKALQQHYGYDQEVLISEIHYTGNQEGGIHPFAKVKFDYITNPLSQNISFLQSWQFTQSKLLKTITVSYKDTIVRKYEFDYNLTESGAHTAHLKKIVLSEYGKTGEEQLIPTIITWGEQNNNLENPIITLSGLPHEHFITGDFNGDGYTDFVVYGKGNQNKDWQFYFFSPTEHIFYPSTQGTTNYPLYFDVYILEGVQRYLFYAADVNGDGCDELIIEELNINLLSYNWSAEVKILSIKNGVKQEIGSESFACRPQILFGDFDGDGFIDILFVKNDLTNPIHFYSKSGLVWNSTFPKTGIPTVTAGEFDGDGKTDIVLHYPDSTLYFYFYDVTQKKFIWNMDYYYSMIETLPFSNNHRIYTGDFNGDGITDILSFKNNSVPQLYFIGSFNVVNIPALRPGCAMSTLTSELDCKILIADLNGDGKDDIIQMTQDMIFIPGQESILLEIFYSKGYINGSYQYDFREVILEIECFPKSNINIADFNNDGILELIIKDVSTHEQKVVSLHQNKQYEFATAITDGIGKAIQLKYTPKYFVAQSLHFLSLGNYVLAYKKYFLPVIDSLWVSNGIGNAFNTWQYEYENPTFSLLRKNFLGFKKFICKNSQTLEKESRSFEFYDYINCVSVSKKQFLVPSKQVVYINALIVSEKNFTYKLHHLPHDRSVPFDSIVVEKNILSDTKKVTTNILNPAGRITSNNTQTYSGSNASNWMHWQTTTYSYDSISFTLHQKKALPAQIITKQQYENSNIVLADTLIYGYYPANSSNKGRLHWERKSNSDGAMTTTYENYTATGLYGKKTVSAGSLSRAETYTYDATQRFVTKIKNPIGHEAKFTYDAKTGNKLSETDANGLTTTYT
ncbi:MAG: FG-GAP-like repeat-containing protein, partial [Lentimicrobiaceae bacterium]|nr:FG-GAP-like repeat-containing protein [Lentimicrobiaceae bacterium]